MVEEWLSMRMVTAIGFGLAGGFALARAHLSALVVNVRLYMAPGTAWRPVGLHVARLAVVITCFTIAALCGAPALIATLVGFMGGRTLVLRQCR